MCDVTMPAWFSGCTHRLNFHLFIVEDDADCGRESSLKRKHHCEFIEIHCHCEESFLKERDVEVIGTAVQGSRAPLSPKPPQTSTPPTQVTFAREVLENTLRLQIREH